LRIGVLGTGMVGKALATKLVAVGYEVRMGSRSAANESAAAWAAAAGDRAGSGSFADAAGFGELVVNATAGAASLEALAAAGGDALAGKVLLEVANPLDFSQGMPPMLSVSNTDSLAEQIQRAHPDALVVKSLNTMRADVMVDPQLVPGHHTVFVCGDDEDAKRRVVELLQSFGWAHDQVLDLGDITAARGLEMYLPFWLRLWASTGTALLNVQVHSCLEEDELEQHEYH
jgi:8-hydroxy-5-deazaflavin:NADPH oxidoreductase